MRITLYSIRLADSNYPVIFTCRGVAMDVLASLSTKGKLKEVRGEFQSDVVPDTVYGKESDVPRILYATEAEANTMHSEDVEEYQVCTFTYTDSVAPRMVELLPSDRRPGSFYNRLLAEENMHGHYYNSGKFAFNGDPELKQGPFWSSTLNTEHSAIFLSEGEMAMPGIDWQAFLKWLWSGLNPNVQVYRINSPKRGVYLAYKDQGTWFIVCQQFNEQTQTYFTTAIPDMTIAYDVEREYVSWSKPAKDLLINNSLPWHMAYPILRLSFLPVTELEQYPTCFTLGWHRINVVLSELSNSLRQAYVDGLLSVWETADGSIRSLKLERDYAWQLANMTQDAFKELSEDFRNYNDENSYVLHSHEKEGGEENADVDNS